MKDLFFFSEKGVLCLFLKPFLESAEMIGTFFWETGLTPAVHSILIFPKPTIWDCRVRVIACIEFQVFFHVLFEGNDD